MLGGLPGSQACPAAAACRKQELSFPVTCSPSPSWHPALCPWLTRRTANIQQCLQHWSSPSTAEHLFHTLLLTMLFLLFLFLLPIFAAQIMLFALCFPLPFLLPLMNSFFDWTQLCKPTSMHKFTSVRYAN